MRLLQSTLIEQFDSTIQEWKTAIADKNACFHVYIPYNYDDNFEKQKYIRDLFNVQFPGIPLVGCSATGEIFNGQMQDNDIVITAMIFEDSTTSVEVLSSFGKVDKNDIRWLLNYTRNIPDLKGIELLTAAPYQKLEDSANIMDDISEDIEIFGGVAVGDDKNPAYVFSNDCSYSSDGSIIVLYKGTDLHMQVNRMFGWKPIGYPLVVTRSEGPVVYEINDKPAYEVYNHYLHIKKDDNFFYDALDFPWEVRVDSDTAYIRHAKSVNPDGSIVMSSNIPSGSKVRLTYGDPRRIIEHTKNTTLLIRDFAPQVVNIINCMGRKLFWSVKEDIEIKEISKHMQTTGFSALGEIMRYKGTTLLNNLSIVTVAMREGPPGDLADMDIETIEKASNMPITARLAIFINTITDELMDKNEQLNEMLYKASHDALTGLLNRGAIERIIYEYSEDADTKNASDWHLIMFDVDDFKQINDQCGHAEGDNILKFIAATLSEYLCDVPNSNAGRWGGEEFMIFLSGHTDDQVKEISNHILDTVKSSSGREKPITISVGTTKHQQGESVEDTISRVDKLMYKAKGLGKDRMCTDI